MSLVKATSSPTATLVTARRTAATLVVVTAATFATNGSLYHRTPNDRRRNQRQSRFPTSAGTTATNRRVCHPSREAGKSLTLAQNFPPDDSPQTHGISPGFPLLAVAISCHGIIAVKIQLCAGRSTVTAGKVCATGAVRITGTTALTGRVFPACQTQHWDRGPLDIPTNAQQPTLRWRSTTQTNAPAAHRPCRVCSSSDASRLPGVRPGHDHRRGHHAFQNFDRDTQVASDYIRSCAGPGSAAVIDAAPIAVSHDQIPVRQRTDPAAAIRRARCWRKLAGERKVAERDGAADACISVGSASPVRAAAKTTRSDDASATGCQTA